MAVLEIRVNNEELKSSDIYRTDTLEAFEDARLHRNLYGPYKTAEEAVAAMLEN
ncbi:MAG: hypothetical protein IJ597_00720 [Synergistaceae bacterium]|nr:hypothetical protein [Synergistaceae bacterium]